ncbi:AAA family ATPase [Dokdonia sp. PRO95]|uniref:AAA family ATPase n=1 Tax=Dokdonia sp. PRO95 TaxID=1239415 RepID=UPI00068F3B3F|nr:AAA family ATPase [Dokdonia sp. PRO95]
MSLEKLKRDLISCGKEFFIDNYTEIKEFSQGNIERDKLDSLITAKAQWTNITTLGNRISAVKMFFENNQVIDALKITIESRAKANVTEKAKDYFKQETGRSYNETKDKILSESNSGLLKEILDTIETEYIKELCDIEEFRYQKGSDKLIEFENYAGLTREEITLLLNQFNDSGLTFTNFVESLDKESDKYQLLTLLGEVVSYCDLHAANKKFYNQYDDNRTLGKAGVRMNDWLDKLLSYKIEDNDLSKLTPSIKNALLYLKDPENGLTMLSENHREKFSIKLLHKTYEPENIIHDLISFFEPYDIEVSNEKNRTTVYCSILYSENVKQLWLNDDDIEVEENPDTKNTNDMKTPLNQIFYGPPGTGKTYNISSEAEKIINSENNSSANTREEKFHRICESVRNISGLEIKANSLYRNERAILWMYGYLLEPPHNATNSIINNEAIANGMDPSPSSWAQYSQYLTQFGFVDDWRKSTEVNLNERGIELKNDLVEFLNENNLTFEDLKNWNQDAPDIVRESYFSAISEIEKDNFTNQMKVIYCVLNLALNNFLRSETEYKKKEASDREEASAYIDIEDDNADIKWIGQIGRSLRGLGIVDNYILDSTGKNTYHLSENGLELVDKIIENWENNYPELFGDFISYENAVEHGRVKFITFHQSYSYEEFIEGIRPKMDSDELTYSLEKGVFKEISDNAKNYPNHNYVIIIDEINRGNISKIFGELITLIEPSKRLFSGNEKEHPKEVTLPYSKKLFGVPKNLYILGTMNTADKSISLLDSALRRRFSFTEMLPNSTVVKDNISIEGIEVEKLFETINSRIEFLIDKDHTIGHSYFLKIKENQTIEALSLIFKNEIIPLLTEYFYGDFEKIQLVLGENKDWKSKSDNKFFNKKTSQQKSLFGKDEAVEGYDEKIIFELNDDLLGLKEDGTIKGKSEDLIKLFKSVYTKKSN